MEEDWGFLHWYCWQESGRRQGEQIMWNVFSSYDRLSRISQFRHSQKIRQILRFLQEPSMFQNYSKYPADLLIIIIHIQPNPLWFTWVKHVYSYPRMYLHMLSLVVSWKKNPAFAVTSIYVAFHKRSTKLVHKKNSFSFPTLWNHRGTDLQKS